jgi:hypothetical protein
VAFGFCQTYGFVISNIGFYWYFSQKIGWHQVTAPKTYAGDIKAFANIHKTFSFVKGISADSVSKPHKF